MNPEREWSESIVLAALLKEPSQLPLFALKPENFERTDHRQVFTAIQHHIEHGFPVEPSALSDTLTTRHGMDYGNILSALVELPTVNAELYAQGLQHSANAEAARGIARELIQSGDVQDAIVKLHGLRMGFGNAIYEPEQLRREVIQSLEGEGVGGLPTGFRDLDRQIGGFHPGDLIVIAARPAMGKTALMLNLAINCAEPVLIFSGEQPAVQCEARILAAHAKVPLEGMRNRNLTQEQINKLGKSIAELPRNYWICDRSAPSLSEIYRHSMQLQRSDGIKAVFVDYIQRMKRDSKKPKHEAVGDNVLGLKELARDLRIPVIALAQVNRQVESRDPERRQPTMSDVKDSGEIEQEADVVITLLREKVYNPNAGPVASLYIAKNRHGPTGYVDLDYLDQFVCFQNHHPRYAA